jgi:hypothetical protein
MSLFSSVVGACLVTGLMLSLMARLVRAATWSAGLVALIVFLVAYYLMYEKNSGISARWRHQQFSTS